MSDADPPLLTPNGINFENFQGHLADRTTQISDHTLLVHNELIELRRALQTSERENKRREQALELHQQRTKELLSEADKNLKQAKKETAILHQQNKKKEAQMQRDYAALATQLSDVKACSSAFIVQTRLALAGFGDSADQLSREMKEALAEEEEANLNEQMRLRAAIEAAERRAADKDDVIEDMQQRNDEMAAKMDGWQVRVKAAEDRVKRLEEDKAGQARQAAESADTIRGLRQDVQAREKEQRETLEKLTAATRAAIEAGEDLASERRAGEGERARCKAAEVVVGELKEQAQAQAAAVAELRQQLATCRAGLQRATAEEAACRGALEECRGRLAETEGRYRRAAEELVAAAAAAKAMHG
jgi:hypothetical protein